MSEIKGEYKTGDPEVDDAMEMLGKGYSDAPLEIHPQTTVIRRKGWEMVEEVVPAFVKISTAFKQEMASIDGNALKVWLFIALSINRNTEQAHPGIRKSAEKCGIAENTVTAKIKELEAAGLLSVNREYRKYNIYEVPDYVSANKTASKSEATASIEAQTASINDQTASKLLRLNQSNQSNQIKPDSRVLSKEKIKEITENTERRILEGLRGAQNSWPGREKIPETIRDLLDTFVRVSGIKPVRGQLMDWLGTGQDWLDIGAQKQDITKAFEESKPNEKGYGGFMVNRPGSLTRTIQKVVGQRRASHVEGTRLERALAEIAEMAR